MRNKGFTLIEVMVVIAILGILAVMVVPQLMSRPEQAKIVKAKSDIMAIENALELYKLDNGFYPTTDQGLVALIKKPDIAPTPNQWKTGGYLKRLPNDPWGNRYQYLNPGSHAEIDVYSYGTQADTTAQDDKSLIGNWDLDKSES